VLNFFIDSPNLSVSAAGTDDKVVGEVAYGSGIQQNNVAGLFVTGSFNSFMGYFYCFQNANLQKNTN